jgi:hypothetical protein
VNRKGPLERLFDPDAAREPQGGAERREHVSMPSSRRVDSRPVEEHVRACASCGSPRYPQDVREVTVPCKNKQHAADGAALEVKRFLRCPKCLAETDVRVLIKNCVLCKHEKYAKQAKKREN